MAQDSLGLEASVLQHRKVLEGLCMIINKIETSAQEEVIKSEVEKNTVVNNNYDNYYNDKSQLLT